MEQDELMLHHGAGTVVRRRGFLQFSTLNPDWPLSAGPYGKLILLCRMCCALKLQQEAPSPWPSTFYRLGGCNEKAAKSLAVSLVTFSSNRLQDIMRGARKSEDLCVK